MTSEELELSVVMQMKPLTYTVKHDLQDLSLRFAEWFVNNVTKFTDPRGADLFVLVVLVRGEERAGSTYRDGQYVKSGTEKDV
jgi:hypothetical protein